MYLKPRTLIALFLFLALAGCWTGFQEDSDDNWLWVNIAGRDTVTQGIAVAIGPEGESYVTGFYKDMPFFGKRRLPSKGELNFFIACYASDGALLWVRSYGNGGYVAAADISIGTDGDIFITGSLGPAILTGAAGQWQIPGGTLTAHQRVPFVARLDQDGDVRWVRLLDDFAGASGKGLAVDEEGYSYVTGGFSRASSLIEKAPKTKASFIARFDPDGEPVWMHDTGPESGGEGAAIKLDHENNIHLVGGAYSLAEKGGYLAMQDTRVRFEGSGTGFTMKLDEAGNLKWVHLLHANDLGASYLSGVGIDQEGNCYVSGQYIGQISFADTLLVNTGKTVDTKEDEELRVRHRDMLVAKYNSQGNPLWIRSGVGGMVSDDGSSIGVAADGTSYVTGSFIGRVQFGSFAVEGSYDPENLKIRSMYVAVHNSDGEAMDAFQNGPTALSAGNDIALRDDIISVTGMVGGTVRFGDITIRESRGTNMFVARLKAVSRTY